MSEALLGCPHCNKPVGFAAAMAGKVVACPHCRGQFQMPERPPMSAPPPLPGRIGSIAKDAGLAFDGDDGTADSTAKAELDSYRAAVTLANIFALGGSAGVLILLGLWIYAAVLPQIRGGEGHANQSTAGIIWLFAGLLVAGLAMIGLFLLRTCILVGVDAARTLRAIERDAAAMPKTK